MTTIKVKYNEIYVKGNPNPDLKGIVIKTPKCTILEVDKIEMKAITEQIQCEFELIDVTVLSEGVLNLSSDEKHQFIKDINHVISWYQGRDVDSCDRIEKIIKTF